MKEWILSVFLLAGRADRLWNRVTEQIEALSCDLNMDTYRLFEAVLALSDKRTRITNFKVIGNLMKEAVFEPETEVILKKAKGESFADIAADFGVSKSTAVRRFNAAIAKCAAVAGSLSFTEKRFESEYRDIPLIWNTVRKLRGAK